MRTLTALALSAYKYCLSPFLPPACRFQPTCSEYAREAVLRFGPFRGAILASWRLMRCNPLFKAGYDPVPETFLGSTPSDNQVMRTQTHSSAQTRSQ